MNWWQLHRRSAVIVALTLLLPALFYMSTVWSLLGTRSQYQTEIDALQPRIGRLRGLLEHEDQLRASTAAIDQQVLNLVYPASDDRTTVSAQLQTDVRQLLVTAGLSVSNSQVLPVRERDTFDHVAVRVTVTGSLLGLDAALSAIADYTPVILVESLDVWPKRQSRRASGAGEQTINATLQLLSLRAVQ